jgi:CheY-like chemotaxis protein
MNNVDETLRWQASIGNEAQQQPQTAAPGEDRPAQAEALVRPRGSEGNQKTILLVDSNLRSRESRAKVMRNKGVMVDCVASADAARVRLRVEKYNLILVDLGRDVDGAEALVQEIRTKNSRQLVGFLVGSPLFVVRSLGDSNSRPRRMPAPAPAAKPGTPAVPGIDFGQKIRDAEAGKTA